VIVGVGQITDRDGDASPLGLMAAAARRAAEDAGTGGPGLLARAGAVAVVDVFSWPIPDPALLLREELGIAGAETVRSVIGGNGPLALLGDLATRIGAGELDVALLAGGEVVTAFRRAMTRGEATGWPTQEDGTAPDRLIGTDRPPSLPEELAAGLAVPASYYPLFEHRLRHRAGRTTEEQQRWIGSWWSRYSEVAAADPDAWRREAVSAEAAGLPGPGNRPISDPYPKSMVADITVDQGAALLVCSAGAAEAAGIARDRWVFPHALAGGHDHWFVGERDALDRSPAIAAIGAALREHTGVTVAELGPVDLYSCFPCAVQIAARELGFDEEDLTRPLTVTGGLHYFGGPANDYVTHALVRLVERLREQPDAIGLSTAVGWYMTKHAAVLLSATPPARPFAAHDVQATVDAGPRREVVADPRGTFTIETFTVAYERDGTPTAGIVVALDATGRRAFARTTDAATVAALLDGDPIGRTVELAGADGVAL
jgi:acetyl-CoA C-acetyltransferase